MRLRAQSPQSRDGSNWQTAVRCFWTRSATFPPRVQIKMLRVLQEWEFERIGGDENNQSGRAPDCRHQQRFRKMRGRRHVPRGLVLSPEHRLHFPAAPARTPGRHSHARGTFSRQILQAERAQNQNGRPSRRGTCSTRIAGRATCANWKTSIERSVVLSERTAKTLTPDLMPLPVASAYAQSQAARTE